MAQPGELGPPVLRVPNGKTAKIPPFQGVGDALGAGERAGAAAPRPACRAAAAPKLLKIAAPIPNWSNVMGPIDSAIYPSPSYRCEETIGFRCFVMISGAGSLVGSIEPATAGTNAAAINNIGRSEASSREYNCTIAM